MRKCLYLLVLLLVYPAIAAPELSESDRQLLADGTTDRDDVLDEQQGFYVLLRNASTWQGDDFGGDAGAAVAPPPDYGFLKDKPEQARGNVYLIEGWVMGSDRWPTKENHDSDKLQTTLNPALGEQVTRWTIATEKGNPDATIIVLFHDPTAKMTAPKPGTQVRVAARFHKLWTISASTGKPFSYPVFVGGASEVVVPAGGSSSSGGSTSSFTIILGAIVIVGGFFYAMRILMRRVSTGGGGGTMLRDRLEEMRREREAMEARGDSDDDEDAESLPEDPIAALDALRERHGDHPD